MKGKAFKSLVALSVIIAFNSGMSARPSSDDGDDTALISPPAKSSFGERMAHARAAKQKGEKVHKERKPRATKDRLPKAPKVPKIAKIGD